MSYISDHPTSFSWRSDVKDVVKKVQARHPWKTYICTYFWHPPYNPPTITRRFDAQSFDVWGGGGTNADNYSGYRGKPLPLELGNKIWNELWNDPDPPQIYWIIWQGRMWWNPRYGGNGWSPAPPGPADSDAGHYKHIHCTMY